MADIPYAVVDVFTTVRFGGNPLAVVLDGRGLTDTEMQQVAAEFGYSETTFILPPADPRHTARVRIFTPTTEVPFAGHPNVGTAYVLAREGSLFGAPVGDAMRFEEGAGIVEVAVLRRDGVVAGATITAPQPLTVGPEVPVALVAACASLDPADVIDSRHPPRVASVGLPFVMAELASRAALSRARPDLARFAEADRAVSVPGLQFALFLYVPEPGAPGHVSARMFAPLDNVIEDPATGSASAALAAFHASLLPGADAEMDMAIIQGVDMGRPSAIRLHVHKVAGEVRGVTISGECVPVMRGVLVG